MTDPGVNEFLVEFDGLLDRLVASLVVDIGVELGSAICRRHHVDDSFVASITELDCAPVRLVEQSLPNLIRCVGLTIHNTTITKNDSRYVTLKRCFKEDIFEGHLRLHDLDLEAHLVHQCHLVRLDKASTLHHQGRGFGHDENLKALLR